MWRLEFKDDFYVFSRDGIEMYDIKKSTCETEREINEWIAHMAEKNWWNENLEKEFIRLWKTVNNYGK